MTKKHTKHPKRKPSKTKSPITIKTASTVASDIHLSNTARDEVLLLERVLAVQEHHYGAEHLALAETLLNLGIAYGNLGDDQKKKALLKRALAIQERHYGLEHLAVAITLVRLGDAYRALGDVQKAKELLERALAIQERADNSEPLELAVTLTRLSVIYRILKDVKKAQALLERAWGVYETHHVTDQVEAAETLANLGDVYRALGDIQKGKELLERALVIEEHHYGVDHVALASTLTNLGSVYQVLKELEKSKALLERALTIKEKHYGLEHVALIATLANLGGVYQALGNVQKSKVLFERTLVLKERHYGLEHPEVAKTLIDLGSVCYALGEIEQGTVFFERTQAIQPSTDTSNPFLSLTRLDSPGTAVTEMVFDLHGYSLEDAKSHILQTLAYANNVKKIRIITGRGNHINKSGSRGVLYQQFHFWLAESAYKDRIEKICTYDGYYELHFRVNGDQNQLSQEEKFLEDQLSSNIDVVKAVADAGDPIAQFIVGSHFMDGAKNAADFKRAFSYYLKSAHSGNTDAMVAVAKSYMVGRGCKQSDPEAIQWLEKALAAGYLDAGLLLGDMYWDGYGAKRDAFKAVFYYAKAVEKNNPVAIRKLASAYSTGIGVKKVDKKKSFELYKKSADLGEVTSQYNVGCMYESGSDVELDLNLARHYFLLAAQGGDSDAQCKIGNAYLRGDFGTIDETQGYYWINLAAENGSTQALQLLKRENTDDISILEKSAQAGNIFDKVTLKLRQRKLDDTEEVLEQLFNESYRELRDLPENNIMHLEFRSRFYLLDEFLNDKNSIYRKKGISVLKKMAEEQCIFSIRRLFYIYYKGVGVNVNETEALAYLEQGYQLEDGKCTMFLAVVYAKKAKREPALLEKVWHYYEQAATLGYPPAHYRMGLYHLDRKETQKGVSYLKKAINLEQDSKTYLSKFDSGTYDTYGPEIKKDAALRISAVYLTSRDEQESAEGFKYVRLAAEWGSEYASQFLEKLKKEGVLNELPSQWLEPIDELLTNDFSSTVRAEIEDGVEMDDASVSDSSDVLLEPSSHTGRGFESTQVQMMVEKYKTTNIEQAFRRAAGFGTVEDLSLILTLAPDVLNQFGLDSKKTALHIAAQQNKKENVRFLLRQGANQTLRDSQNKMALEYCPGMVDDQETVMNDAASRAPMLVQFSRGEQSKMVESDHNDFIEDEYSPIKLCRIL